MKTVIIGAKGMLGQDLIRVFSSPDLYLWDREDVDITNADQVKEKLVALRPQLIINAAAYNAVDDCEKNIETAMNVNGHGPAHVAKVAEDLGAMLVHYSSDYVFDGRDKRGYAEDAMPDPVSAYGFSKRQGEKGVLENCQRHYVIRTSRLFGKPAVSEGAKKSFVDTMLGLAQDRDELQVVNEEWSNPTYTPDLAQETKWLVENKLPYGIYHVTNDGACTWYDFASEAFALANVDVKLTPVASGAFPRPAKRPAYSSLINTRLPRLRPWQEALAEYLEER